MTTLRNSTTTASIVLEKHAPWERIKTKQLAVLLNTDPGTLAAWRYREVGPAPIAAPGGTPRYLVSDVVRWLLRQIGTDASHEDVLRMHFAQLGLDGIETATPAQLRSLEAVFSEPG